MQRTQRPLHSLLLVATMVIGAMLFTSCEDAGEQPVPENARLRLLHMAFDAPSVDVRIDGALVASAVQPMVSSGYQAVAEGSRRIAVTNVGATAELLATTATFKSNTTYSVIAFPPAAAVSAVLVEEPRLITVGSSAVRLANATTDGGSLEVRVAGTSTSLAGPVGQANVSATTETTAGSYMMGVYRGSTLLAEFGPVSLAAQTSYTLVAHGTLATTDNVPFGLRVFADAGDGLAYVDAPIASLDARVMMVNALVGTQRVDAVVDGSKIATVPFAENTPYVSVQPGSRLFSFVSGGTPVISGQLTFASRASYTIFGTGTIVPADVAPIVLEDVTTPNAAQALVRFVHASPDAGKVDVVTPLGPSDYQIPAMQGVSFREVSKSSTTGLNYLQLPPSPEGTPYLLKFRQSGTTTILTTLENVSLQAGKIYTLWIGGRVSNGTLTAKLISH